MAKQTILVAEDSPTTRRKIAGILEDQGYHVLTAEDGQQAIELTHEYHPELVVLDIVLPKKNGYQVCRSIKSDPDLAIKVMIVTSKAMEKDRIWSQRQGADGYLAKPVDPGKLIELVEALISVPTQ